FFFSSRRRHTRFSRDWSSDVCSSDLTAEQRTDIADDMPATEAVAILFRQEHRYTERTATWNDAHLVDRIVLGHQAPNDGVPCLRSEERRVGKECRSG